MTSRELVLSRTFSSRIDLSESPILEGSEINVYRTVYKSASARFNSPKWQESVNLESSRFSIKPLTEHVGAHFLPGGTCWDLIEWREFGQAETGFDPKAIAGLGNRLIEKGNTATLVVRVDMFSPLLSRWFQEGFRIAGTISSTARLCARAIRADVPVSKVITGETRCVLVMGRPNPNFLAQARAIGRCGIPVFGVLTRGEPPAIAKSSRYLRGILNAQNCSDSAVAEIIYQFAIAQPQKPVLMFAGDYDLGLAARIWPSIRDSVEAVTDPVAAARLNDKQAQVDVALRAGVPVPRSATVDTREGLGAIADFNYPLIGRPVEVARKGRFEGKVYVAGDRETLVKKLGPILDDGSASVLIQEYIPGPGDQHYFLLASCDNSGDFATPMMGRKLLENPKGRTNVGETLVDQQLESLSRRAFSAFGISGVLGVEFKKDERNGTFYYIETNFRPDNFVAIAAASGINLNLMTYLRVCGLEDIYQPLFQRYVIWQDASLVLLSGLRGKRVKRAARRGPKGDRMPVVDALWAIDDPWPAFVWYGLKVVKLIKKLGSRIASKAIPGFSEQNR